jgi:hypothetical protein
MVKTVDHTNAVMRELLRRLRSVTPENADQNPQMAKATEYATKTTQNLFHRMAGGWWNGRDEVGLSAFAITKFVAHMLSLKFVLFLLFLRWWSNYNNRTSFSRWVFRKQFFVVVSTLCVLYHQSDHYDYPMRHSVVIIAIVSCHLWDGCASTLIAQNFAELIAKTTVSSVDRGLVGEGWELTFVAIPFLLRLSLLLFDKHSYGTLVAILVRIMLTGVIVWPLVTLFVVSYTHFNKVVDSILTTHFDNLFRVTFNRERFFATVSLSWRSWKNMMMFAAMAMLISLMGAVAMAVSEAGAGASGKRAFNWADDSLLVFAYYAIHNMGIQLISVLCCVLCHGTTKDISVLASGFIITKVLSALNRHTGLSCLFLYRNPVLAIQVGLIFMVGGILSSFRKEGTKMSRALIISFLVQLYFFSSDYAPDGGLKPFRYFIKWLDISMLPVAGFFLALQINFHFWIDQYLDLNAVYAVHSEYIGDPFTPVDPILRAIDPASPLPTIREALFGADGDDACLLLDFPPAMDGVNWRNTLEQTLEDSEAFLNDCIRGSEVLPGLAAEGRDLLLAVCLYSGNRPDELPLYRCFNTPYIRRDRDKQSIANTLKFMRLVLEAISMMEGIDSLVFRGTAYRSQHLTEPSMMEKWDDCLNHFAVGTALTLAPLTSTSESEEVAINFQRGKESYKLLYIMRDIRGVKISSLSQYPNEKEIIWRPPSAFVIVAREKDPASGWLRVTLTPKQERPDFGYLMQGPF